MDFIGRCLDSILTNDFPRDKVEILVVEGMSEDGTRDVVEGYAGRYPSIRMIDNTRRLTPFAFNEGIRHSRGSLVMIMSAHATYEKDYIRKCVEASAKYGADNVVGVWKILPRNDSPVAGAIVTALSSPFGAGNAKYKTGVSKEPEWTDTGAYGCYRREVFEKVGLFNENLTRGQDMEFNLRLLRAGGRTLLLPDAVVYYYARSEFWTFCKYNWGNGVWAVYPMKFVSHMPVSLRHLVPLVFVAGLLGSLGLSLFFPAFWWLFAVVSGSYVLASLYFSTRLAVSKKNPSYLFLLPPVFAALHLGYGLGSLWGLIKVATSIQFWKNRIRRNHQ